MAEEIEARVKELEAMARDILLSGAPPTLTASLIADIVHDLAPPVLHEIASGIKIVDRITKGDVIGMVTWIGELMVPPPVNRFIPTHILNYLVRKMAEVPTR